MLRSLIPSILASLGSFIILLATSMPLFDWQISKVATDFPEIYEVHLLPSPWITRLGDSLDDSNYVSLGKVYVTEDGDSCHHEDLGFVIRRSEKDKALEKISINFTEKNGQWLYLWGARLIFLTGIYIWWFITFHEHRSFLSAITFTLIAIVFYVGLTQVIRPLLPRVVPIEYLGMLDCYHGIITLNASLSKIHYESLSVFFTGILLELGAIGIMARQIISSVTGRKAVPN